MDDTASRERCCTGSRFSASYLDPRLRNVFEKLYLIIGAVATAPLLVAQRNSEPALASVVCSHSGNRHEDSMTDTTPEPISSERLTEAATESVEQGVEIRSRV